jgi:carbon monoxide dehydrogenase subunit G
MRVRRTLEVPYPPEEVFDFLADLRNEQLWHPDVDEVELESGGPVEKGATFRARYRRLGTVELELLELERPRRLVVRATGATRAVYETRLEAVGEGTKLVTVADAQLRGPARLLWPILHGRIQKDFQSRAALLVEGLARNHADAGP